MSAEAEFQFGAPMSEPLVCAILLVNGREKMVRRAVESFRAQTYNRKRLYVYDTGATPCTESLPDGYPDFNIVYHRGLNNGQTIGALRNTANWWGLRPSATSDPDADIICHWDSDDYSGPNRIAEQVALLQSSGAEVVGYRTAAFWDTRVCRSCKHGQPYLDPQDDRPGRWHGTSLGPHRCDSTAWIYDSHAPNRIVGASMMYTRAAWERNKFRDLNTGEDYHFAMRCNVVGVSGLHAHPTVNGAELMDPQSDAMQPRLICGIHGSNTADYSRLSRQTWRREPSLDQICAERMKL